MPDAQGRFRGISVPDLPWLNDKTREDTRPPKKTNRDTKAKLK